MGRHHPAPLHRHPPGQSWLRRWARQGLGLLAAFILALPLCEARPTSANVQTGLQKVRVQLKWRHQFQFAGFYAALAQGYFRDAGLDVSLIEGGPDIDPTDRVVAGEAEFGVGNSSLILDFNAGRPVMAIAAIFQHSPFVILARVDPALRTVGDLAGKTLMGEPHSAELTVYLKKAGVDLNRIKIVPHTGTTLSLVAPGPEQVDATTAYISTEPFEATRRGIPYQIFNPRDLNINFYGDTLFTTQAIAQAHPRQVAAMREALIRGWRYALAHQAEIVDLIVAQYHPKMERIELNLEAQAIYNLFQADVVDIGYMSRDRWKAIGDTYAENGMLPKAYRLKGFLFEPEGTLPPWAYQALIWGALAIGLGGLLVAYIILLNRRLVASLHTLEAQTVQLEAANAELARLSTLDALTGLYNRRYFDTCLNSERNRAARNGQPLSLLMIDVDNFKQYNDSLGHPAGDLCLQRIADVLRQNAQRSGEFAARIGGEEFAIVTSNQNRDAVAALAQRILTDIAGLEIPHPASPQGHVTVSIGSSTFEQGQPLDAETLIAEADDALYQAKETGRNRWIAAGVIAQARSLDG